MGWEGAPHPADDSAHYSVQAPAVGDPLELVFARVVEDQAGADHQVLDGLETRTSDGPANAATRAPI